MEQKIVSELLIRLSNVLTIILLFVQGAGHSPQEYKRRECFDMFDRFIHYFPL
jgi:hypothetical protein